MLVLRVVESRLDSAYSASTQSPALTLKFLCEELPGVWFPRPRRCKQSRKYKSHMTQAENSVFWWTELCGEPKWINHIKHWTPLLTVGIYEKITIPSHTHSPLAVLPAPWIPKVRCHLWTYMYHKIHGCPHLTLLGSVSHGLSTFCFVCS